MGHIISIANNKGGCGKTTTTCNLADALGKRDKQVLVVDMDSQCNTTNRLLPTGAHIKESVFDVLDPDTASLNVNNFFYPTKCKNVNLLPNLSVTANLEPDLIKAGGESFLAVRNFLRDKIINDYDFILLDCPPNMGSFVLCSLYASDFVIVPIRAGSMDSVEGLVKAIDLINAIKEKGNPDLKFLRILINCVDKRTSISKAVVDQTKRIFEKDQLFNTTIPINTAFERSEARGETIFQTDATTLGARAFRSLAKELISIIGE